MSYETPHTDAALAAIKPAVQADIDLHVKAAKAAFGAAIAEGKLNTAFQAVEHAKAHDQAAAAEMATELLAADELKRTGAPAAPKPKPKSAPKKTQAAPVADPDDDANNEPTATPAQPAPAQAPDDGEPAWLDRFTRSRIEPIEDKVIDHDNLLVGSDGNGGLVKDMVDAQDDIARLNEAVFDENGNRRRVRVRTRTIHDEPINKAAIAIAGVVAFLLFLLLAGSQQGWTIGLVVGAVAGLVAAAIANVIGVKLHRSNNSTQTASAA